MNMVCSPLVLVVHEPHVEVQLEENGPVKAVMESKGLRQRAL